MKEELRVYNFLNKIRIGIKANTNQLDKCEENLEEIALNNSEYDRLIVVNTKSNNKILRDERYPYLWKKSKGKKTQYYRYSTLVREIIKNSDLSYELFEYTPDNEGILGTLRTIYCQSDVANKDALVHASILNINGEGIILVGPCRSGKTTLTLGFLREMKGRLINDGISLIHKKKDLLQGFYLPRPIYLRFFSIIQDPNLHNLLHEYNLRESYQYFDHEVLQKIIKENAMHVDAGITVSRRKVSQIYGIDTLTQTTINRLVLIDYSDNFKIYKISQSEALKKLRHNEFPLRDTFTLLKLQREIKPPEISQIKDGWLNKVSCKFISYDSKKHMNRHILEEILR